MTSLNRTMPIRYHTLKSVSSLSIRIFLSAILIFGQGCVSSGRKASSGDPSAQPAIAQDEVAIGEKIHQQILQSFYPYTDPRVVQHVNMIGNRLAEFVDRKDLPYRFTVLYNEKIYATSSPGGFVYVTTGMLAFLQNDAELAAVIAHEIGQLQYRDPKLSQSQKVLEMITRTGATVGPAFGEIGMLAVLGLALVNAMAESRVLTQGERLIQADGRAFQYMVQAGYDPQGLIDFFYSFLNADKKIIPYFMDYYQSRPIDEQRIEHVNAEFAKLSLDGKTLPVNRKDYQEAMKGVREMYRTY